MKWPYEKACVVSVLLILEGVPICDSVAGSGDRDQDRTGGGRGSHRDLAENQPCSL